MNALLKRFLFIWFHCFAVYQLNAVDNHHFYRASNFFPIFHEPRFWQEGLSSFDVFFSGGHTDQSAYGCSQPFNLCHTKDCLLNICGYYNIQELGRNLPNVDLTNPVDLALINLANTPSRENFATLSFRGEFSIFEANLFYTQNIIDGFFLQFHAPFRRLKIYNIESCDLSPNDNLFPNRNTPAWTTFLSLYDQFLDRYQISTASQCNNFIGDTTVLLGWTVNHDDTEILDFIDMSFRIGVLIPTGQKADPNYIFDLPTGYNGLVGVPITFDVAFGFFDWVTMGLHMGVISFNEQNQNVRVATSPDQTGLIALEQAFARVKGGTLWDAVGYFKADHICMGFSLLFGYTFASKKANRIIFPADCCNAPKSECLELEGCLDVCDLVNSAWNMQTVHLLLEYDFTPNESIFMCPRLGFFVNIPVGGKRIFDTTTGGLYTGFDVSWNF